jgi:hypothetical protein
MPAYAKDGNVVCFFQRAQKLKTFALTELTAAGAGLSCACLLLWRPGQLY